MKILYTILALSPSGGARIIFEHASRLTQRGHEVYIIPLQGDLKIGWYPRKFIHFQLAPTNELASIAKGMDVILATEANTAEPVAELETKAEKFYFVQMRESLFFMNTNPRWAGQVELNYEKMKGVLKPIVISWWLKDFLEQEYGYENIPIVPNGVNTDMFYPDPKWPKGNIPRVLIEGHQHSEAKDIQFMSINAAEWYRGNVRPIELWGFSQLPPPQDYQGFNSYWIMPSQEEIRQIYSSCDVLLKASRYEGRECVSVEAMACGTPVVRAIIKGDDDLIHGYNCLLCKYDEANTFCNNLAAVLSQEIIRNSLITNGLQYVKLNLDWDDKIDRLETIFSGHEPDPIPRKEELWEA